MLECPLYHSINDKLQSLFEDVILKSLESFFQLDHPVDIGLTLTDAIALDHSSELANLTTSRGYTSLYFV